ncbi:repetitive organellar protein [Daktulosphaira vitifoliae]|uniref:repetitive organellar protein n=1 Tax=Daktulosphaira vitifoliae TaxID=58002 RepID=UPI0021A9CB8F|nr:repetitive organellar protein [Daktulosphaira vitifoliae]
MAKKENQEGEILKNEEVLQIKYEENNKLTKKFLQEINEMKNKIDIYEISNEVHKNFKQKPVKTSEFQTFMKIIDNGHTIEETKTISSKEVTIKNYVLQKEIDRLNNEIVKKDDSCDNLQEENKKLNEEKEKYTYQLSLLKEKIKKYEKDVDTLSGNLKTRDFELGRILKELNLLEKKYKHEQMTYEKQRSLFLKTNDDNKILKEMVKKLEMTLRENEEKYLKLITKNEDALSKCSKEKEILILAFRKQLELIDSLKKQNIRIKLHDDITVLEDEFSKFLENK